MVAMSAPEASADQGAIESPFTKVEDFASDIKDYVGSVADKAEREAARKQRAADRAAVVAEADDQLGVPYVYGGTTPSGFDCSGFTRWVYEHALGIDLPRTAAEQSALVFMNVEGEVTEEILASLRAAIDLKNLWYISL